MNVRSLSHNYEENQDSLSWIDDPFNLKGAFTGVKQVSHQRNLTDYAENLVSHYGKYQDDQYALYLEMLPDDEQNELARLYIESIDREIEYACYGRDESINSDFLCSMLAMLKDNNQEKQISFAETTRKNIISYYKKSLNAILQNACDIFHRLQMHHDGYAYEDSEDGDVIWGGF
ncbi:MAG TPA: hypothetical protein ACFYDZ_00225 [Candidatus Brocadiaceae bacterium]